jgi:hypothetical protein
VTNSGRPSQSRLDIVATQGAYLVPRPHTPVFEKSYDESFATALDRAFNALNVEQLLRHTMYREAADEWPIGHTPPEVKERRLAELRAMDDMEWATSDEDSGGDEGDDVTPYAKTRVEKAPPAGERAWRTGPQEAHGLPTPPLSTCSPLPMAEERRRPLDEKEYPRTTRVIPTASPDIREGDKLDGSEAKGRKRQRADDIDDRNKWNGECPAKAQKTATPRQEKRCSPTRPETSWSRVSCVGTKCH